MNEQPIKRKRGRPKGSGKRGKGPFPLNKTLDRYFESMKWNEFWNKIKASNPIVYIVVKNKGLIERVLIKRAIPGEEFIVKEDKFRGSEVAKIIEPTDEEILKEIGILQKQIEPLPFDDNNLSLLENNLPPIENNLPEQNEEVDIKVGDKIIIRNEGMTGTVEVLELYEDEQKFKVKFPSSGKEVVKDAADFIKLA